MSLPSRCLANNYKAIPDPDQDTVIASERTGWPGHRLIAGTPWRMLPAATAQPQ